MPDLLGKLMLQNPLTFRLDEEMKKVSGIRFYYISALHQTRKDKEAFELLEEKEGLEMEDIREGEDSIALL